ARANIIPHPNSLKALNTFIESIKGKQGKSWEEQWGKEYSDKRKQKYSIDFSGPKNHRFGKPSPKKSGNGIGGWYKNWYFRSLLELSFMINFIEAKCIPWQPAEDIKYRVPYTHYTGRARNYFADFILENNTMVEVKPSKLCKTPLVILKRVAAEDFCNKNGMVYKIFSEKDFKKLTILEVQSMLNDGKVELSKNKDIEYIKNFK
ncbi:MAG: TnsA endonuclease N-terminal domain-containing protein, partial [Chloroflexota bacterium]